MHDKTWFSIAELCMLIINSSLKTFLLAERIFQIKWDISRGNACVKQKEWFYIDFRKRRRFCSGIQRVFSACLGRSKTRHAWTVIRLLLCLYASFSCIFIRANINKGLWKRFSFYDKYNWRQKECLINDKNSLEIGGETVEYRTFVLKKITTKNCP